MDQLLLLASLAEAWGSRGGALGARVPEERLSALLHYKLSARATKTSRIFLAYPSSSAARRFEQPK